MIDVEEIRRKLAIFVEKRNQEYEAYINRRLKELQKNYPHHAKHYK